MTSTDNGTSRTETPGAAFDAVAWLRDAEGMGYGVHATPAGGIAIDLDRVADPCGDGLLALLGANRPGSIKEVSRFLEGRNSCQADRA